MSSSSLRDRIIEKAGLRCSTKGCTKLRVRGRLVPYCALCAKRKAKFGDPKQERVERRRLEPFVAMAKRFLRQHRSDEPVTAALATMQELLSIADEPEPPSSFPKKHASLSGKRRGQKNPAWLVWREFHRLRHPKSKFSRRGVPLGSKGGFTGESIVVPQEPVSAEEALTAALSVWIAYEIIGSSLFVNDGAPLTFLLADSVLRLRKLETNGYTRRAIAESTKHTVGQRLRDELGAFFIRATEAIRVEEAARVARKAVMRKPIEPKVRSSTSVSEQEQKQWNKLNVRSSTNEPTPPTTQEERPTNDEGGRNSLTARIREDADASRSRVSQLLARARQQASR